MPFVGRVGLPFIEAESSQGKSGLHGTWYNVCRTFGTYIHLYVVGPLLLPTYIVRSTTGVVERRG